MWRTWDLDLVRRSLGGLAATLSVIVVVFLAEQLSTLIETLVENRIAFAELPWVLALTAPEIIVTAMPLAVLIGVYRALLDARDASETVAMAGAGVGPWRLLGGLVGMAAVGSLVVILVAGFVDPLSRGIRDRLFLEAGRALVVAAIREGLEPGRFYSLNGYSFVSPVAGPNGRRLVIFFPRRDGEERIVATDDYVLDEVDGNVFRLKLRNVVVSDVSVEAEKASVRSSGFRVGSLVHEVDLDEALREQPLEDRPEYRAMTELLASDDPRHRFRTRATEILARSLLVIGAVFAATIAVSFAAGPWRFVALPAAGAVVVVLDLLLVRVARILRAWPAGPYFSTMAAVVAVMLVLLALAAAARHSGLVAPRRGRA